MFFRYFAKREVIIATVVRKVDYTAYYALEEIYKHSIIVEFFDGGREEYYTTKPIWNRFINGETYEFIISRFNFTDEWAVDTIKKHMKMV